MPLTNFTWNFLNVGNVPTFRTVLLGVYTGFAKSVFSLYFVRVKSNSFALLHYFPIFLVIEAVPSPFQPPPWNIELRAVSQPEPATWVYSPLSGGSLALKLIGFHPHFTQIPCPSSLCYKHLAFYCRHLLIYPFLVRKRGGEDWKALLKEYCFPLAGPDAEAGNPSTNNPLRLVSKQNYGLQDVSNAW
jgi:hypothetical protein